MTLEDSLKTEIAELRGVAETLKEDGGHLSAEERLFAAKCMEQILDDHKAQPAVTDEMIAAGVNEFTSFFGGDCDEKLAAEICAAVFKAMMPP